MVRPYAESPRQKYRHIPSSHGCLEVHGGMRDMNMYGPRSREHREPPRWRERSGSPGFPRRPAYMDRQQVPAEHARWGPRAHSPAHRYPVSSGYQREHRRQSHPALWSGRHPPHRLPYRGHGPPLSPDHYYDEGSPGRLWTPSPPPHRQHNVELERGWGAVLRPWRERWPRGGGMHREHWNGEGGFSRPRSGERRFSPRRKSREFHGRSPFPERWSAEREAMTHGRNEMAREGGRRSSEWGHKPSPRHPQVSPKWRAAPSSTTASAAAASPPSSLPRFRHAPQDGISRHPLKRRNQDDEMEFEHMAKRARREESQRPVSSRGFGGRPLSLKDKSRLLKGRMLREASVLRTAPPSTKVEEDKAPKQKRPPVKDKAEKKQLPDRKEASQEAAEVHTLKKQALKKVPCKSPPVPEASDKPQGSTETLTIKVDTRHNLSTYSYSPSPSDRQISRDLVTVSQRGTESRTAVRTSASWRTQDSKTGNYCSPLAQQTLTLNERFSKLQNQRSPREESSCFPGLKIERKIDVPLNHRAAKLKKVTPPKSSLHSASPEGKPAAQGPAPARHLGDGPKPLMATLVLRPSVSHKPAIKKSQSIISKHHHIQALRQRDPASHSKGHGPSYTRGPFLHR